METQASVCWDLLPACLFTAEVSRPVKRFPVRAAQDVTSRHAAVAR